MTTVYYHMDMYAREERSYLIKIKVNFVHTQRTHKNGISKEASMSTGIKELRKTKDDKASHNSEKVDEAGKTCVRGAQIFNSIFKKFSKKIYTVPRKNMVVLQLIMYSMIDLPNNHDCLANLHTKLQFANLCPL